MYFKKSTVKIAVVVIILFAILTPLVTFCMANPFGFFNIGDYVKFRYVMSLMDNEYYKEISDEDKIDGALLGLSCSAEDPYTVYMNKEMNEEFMDDVNQEDYVGIGVYITADTEDNTVMVISAFDGSPAAEAGITTGDKILTVDGENVYGDNLDECSRKTQGTAGTTVKISVLKESTGEIKEFELVRSEIERKTVSGKITDDNIGIIRISQFSANTYNEFADTFNSLVDQNLSKLVLDLRNNPGGYIDIAVDIADAFVDDGVITYTLDKRNRKEEYKASSGKTEIPMVILINGGSASASEVLAGAMRDLNNVPLIGEKSFGKGVVQNVFPLLDGSSLKVTVARYFTPNGFCIDDSKGLEPDVKVEAPENSEVDITKLDTENDIQLKEAINYLKNK